MEMANTQTWWGGGDGKYLQVVEGGTDYKSKMGVKLESKKLDTSSNNNLDIALSKGSNSDIN